MNNKSIAKALLAAFVSGDCTRIEGDRVEFKIDGLTLRCKDTRAAVYAVSEKYRKGLRPTLPSMKPRQVSRKFSITTFKEFLQDQEPDNAVHYAQLFDWNNMSPEIQASVRHAAGIRG